MVWGCQHETMCVCECYMCVVSWFEVVNMRPCVFVSIICAWSHGMRLSTWDQVFVGVICGANRHDDVDNWPFLDTMRKEFDCNEVRYWPNVRNLYIYIWWRHTKNRYELRQGRVTYLNDECDVRGQVPSLRKCVDHERKFDEDSVDVDPRRDAEKHDAKVNRKWELTQWRQPIHDDVKEMLL